MIFTELPEEFWPENFLFPERVEVDQATFTQEVEDSEYHTHHYETGAPFMFIFADAKHVEYADAYTGQLLLPPEMALVPIFKSIAKSKGPFVIGAQYGFVQRGSGFPYQCQPRKDDTYCQRFLSPFWCAYGPGIGDELGFREMFRRRVVKKFNLTRYSSYIGLRSTNVYSYQIRQHGVTAVLCSERQHLYYSPEEIDAENE